MYATPRSAPQPTKKTANDDSSCPSLGHIATLASTLFRSTVRNRLMVPAWLRQAPRDASPAPTLSQSATTWGELERQRQHSRATARRNALLARSDAPLAAAERQQRRLVRALLPAATAAAGKRLPRSTSQTMSMVDAMARSKKRRVDSVDTSTSSSSEGLVDDLANVFEALLCESIQLTLQVNNDQELHIYPFGATGRCSNFSIPGKLLDTDEANIVQYLAMTAEEWADCERYSATKSGETLVGSTGANDTFELALDRVELVWTVVEPLMYGGGVHTRARHALEAALHATAARRRIVEAGLFSSIERLAHAVHMAVLPRAQLSREAFVMSEAYAREFVVAHHVETVDSRQYVELIHDQARTKRI